MTDSTSPNHQRIALVTGTLAETSVRAAAEELRRVFGLEVHVTVLKIQVAALMTADWLSRKLPGDLKRFDRVILTGYVRGDVDALSEQLGVPVELGPKDVMDLPEMFGAASGSREGYGEYDVEIIAEINHAATLPPEVIFAEADALRAAGADVIDVGCDPSADREPWGEVGAVVRELVARGHRVSVDSFHVDEIAAACAAGAELVLSVNTSNRDAAADWGTEVVVVPDLEMVSDTIFLKTVSDTVSVLERAGVRYRIDPVIEPIGFGFAASLGRYLDVRKAFPEAEMMMGVGNLSEMTQVDSAGVNVTLMGFCQEVGIRSVLTTQVINWARSSVAELDVARRLCFHAVKRGMPPKHLDPRLVALRDEKLKPRGAAALDKLASKLTDPNFRIFAEGGKVHIMNRDLHLSGEDVFDLFAQLPEGSADPAHAFYLGYEMAKALTALTLGKQYTQDQALDWGMHTRPEKPHGGADAT